MLCNGIKWIGLRLSTAKLSSKRLRIANPHRDKVQPGASVPAATSKF